MKTTVELLDALKSHRNGISDYQVAKLLGVRQQTVSNWRTRKDFFGEETALRVAKILNLDPGYVIACAHAERAKTPEIQAVWKSIADRICIMLSRHRHPYRPLHSHFCQA